ncbi:MAG: glycerol dehydrogenase [Kiritimatiellia bacterium]
MKKAIFFPGRYIQGNGVLAEAGQYVGVFGQRAIVLWGQRTCQAVGEQLRAALQTKEIQLEAVAFGGECTREEARRIADVATRMGTEVVIGVGGGKVCDTAKAVAAACERRLVLIPTIASNDAPTSSCTVWYNKAGMCVGHTVWKTSPDLVLVDTDVIAAAPVRYLVSGMGDALATWPEAQATAQSGALTFAGGLPTMAALSLARLCFDTILEHGLDAKAAAEAHTVTAAIEKITEANVLLSGIGWESGGLACAHAIANALSFFSETAGRLHGEKVAFGLLTQLCLDPAYRESQAPRIADFMVKVGLPVTFTELGLGSPDPERLLRFAMRVTAPGSTAHHHPFPVTPDAIRRAMLEADALGRQRKELFQARSAKQNNNSREQP